MTTLWRIVFLFFLSFFRNKFSLIETSTFSSSLISNETSFIKNSISMKVKIIHTAFIHSFHCVLSFTFPCIIRYRIYFSRRAKRNEIPFKFCGRKIEIYINFPPLLEPFISIPAGSSWPASNGTYCRGGDCSSCFCAWKVFARFKFVRAEMEAFKGIRSNLFEENSLLVFYQVCK